MDEQAAVGVTVVAEVAEPRDLKVEQTGALASFVLDRPKALNALTTAMRTDMSERFPVFARDPNVYAVVIRSTSPRAFSAGADVREVTTWGRTDPERARRSFADEYRLNWLLECFSKPTVSLISGLCMGGGNGISLYGTHRVAAEGYQFAMPETAIGLFPDVGVAQVFGRLPDAIGVYLGLTGRSIGRADAYRLGFATHCIVSERFTEIMDALADAQPVDPLLDDRHCDPGAGDLDHVRETIARCFSAATVGEIIARLQAVTSAHADWARGVLSDLAKKSPTSLAVTLKHIRDAAAFDLRETLVVDYRLACRCLDGQDFYEGVRAVVIEKDGAPKWQPAAVDGVSEDIVQSFFKPLGPADLELPTRADMQEARV